MVYDELDKSVDELEPSKFMIVKKSSNAAQFFQLIWSE